MNIGEENSSIFSLVEMCYMLSASVKVSVVLTSAEVIDLAGSVD